MLKHIIFINEGSTWLLYKQKNKMKLNMFGALSRIAHSETAAAELSPAPRRGVTSREHGWRAARKCSSVCSVQSVGSAFPRRCYHGVCLSLLLRKRRGELQLHNRFLPHTAILMHWMLIERMNNRIWLSSYWKCSNSKVAELGHGRFIYNISASRRRIKSGQEKFYRKFAEPDFRLLTGKRSE